MRESDIAPLVPALAAAFHCESGQASNMRAKAIPHLFVVKAQR